MQYKLKDKDYLELWQYFEDRAVSTKGAMFNTITWVLGYAAALLGFIFTKIFDLDQSQAAISPKLLIALSLAGVVICIYAFVALGESAKHIHRNWKRADRCKEKICGLNEILNAALLIQIEDTRNVESSESKSLSRLISSQVLNQVANTSKTVKKAIPKIWYQLGIVVCLFFAAFFGLFVLGIQMHFKL